MKEDDNTTYSARRLPASVNVARAKRTFEVVWDDGHVSSFRLADLRSMCDCANCRDEREKRGKTPEPGGGRSLPVLGVASRDEVVSVENVGRYAFGVKWRDAHYSIYSYNYLIDHCLCEACGA